MSGAGGMMIDGVTDGVNRTMKDAIGSQNNFFGGGPQMRDMRYRGPEERGGGNPIDQPIFGFNPMPSPDVMPPDWQDTMPYDPNPDFGGGKGGFQPPDPIGIDPSPIQGGGGGGGNGPGLDHLKDYGPVVDQMKQYVQSMSGLIDQINSKF
jgi:hypothetical protein